MQQNSLKKLIFDSIMTFFNEKKLLGDVQSGFRPSECECHLLSIAHDFFKSFDCNPLLEVTGIVLDISKGFDNV